MKKAATKAIAIAIVFGAVFAAFGLFAPRLWNSPDETAMAFFAKNLALSGQLWRVEAYNLFQADIVHPRSIVSLDGYLLPASFYGAIYVFALAYKVLGVIGLSLVTPLATAVAGICVFFALRRLMDERRALIAQFLFFANPAVWYFASRGLYPNLLFVDMAIIGVSVLYLRPWRALAKGRGNATLEAAIDNAVGAFFLGAAFLVRPVEFIWLAPLLAYAAWRNRRAIGWLRAAVCTAVGLAFVGVFLYTNQHLYGSPFTVGYTVGANNPGIAVPALSAGSRLPAAISSPRPFILPFGFHPRLALVNLWNYVGLIFWWLPALAAVGTLLTRDRDNRRRWGRAFLFSAAVLGVYYGSGIFVDSSVSQWTVGSSYVRYFLPAIVLLIPLAAEGIERLSRGRRFVAPLVLAAFAALGAWTVYFRSPESLVPMAATLNRYAEIKAYVLKETSPGSVIITERSDKIFFPERKVVMNLRDQSTLDNLERLAYNGLYYYGITIAEAELPSINEKLHAHKLQLGRIKSFGNETLYGITKEQ